VFGRTAPFSPRPGVPAPPVPAAPIPPYTEPEPDEPLGGAEPPPELPEPAGDEPGGSDEPWLDEAAPQLDSALLEPAPVADERFADATENALPSPVHVVVDREARVRSGPPEFRSTAGRVPYWARVRINETRGEYVRVSAPDGTEYGWTKASNVGTFFKDLPHLSSAPLAAPQPLPASPVASTLGRALTDTYNRLGGLMALLGMETGIRLAAALAVWYVESAGRRHPARAIIRFENHLFFNRWGSAHPDVYDAHFQHGGRGGIPEESWKNHRWRATVAQPFATFHGDQDAEYRVLAFATRLSNEETALQCISIGGSQILVSNHRMIGYDTARGMYDAFQAGERAHVLGFFDFCNYRYGHGARRGEMLRDLALLRWEDFARGYNGGGQVPEYAGHLRNAYAVAVTTTAAAATPGVMPVGATMAR
jgi:N-acetylmuramidase-like protein